MRSVVAAAWLIASATACHQTPEPKAACRCPPEAAHVDANGSVPPGLHETLARAGMRFGDFACNSQNRYGTDLNAAAEAGARKLLQILSPGAAGQTDRALVEQLEDASLWLMVRALLVDGDNNNFGAIILKDRYWSDEQSQRHPLVVFRTAFVPDPQRSGSCYQSLLQAGHVRHVVNLYDGDMLVSDLVAGERQAAAEAGASYVRTAELGYGQWRYAVRDATAADGGVDEAMQTAGQLIREQILALAASHRAVTSSSTAAGACTAPA